jgi:microcystin degradation protein MlrC
VKIAIAGFQHETNTFAPSLATFEEFAKQDAWPAMLMGDDVVAVMTGVNIPITGFIDEAARSTDWELLPILWCSAEPSSYVTDDAYERIVAMILDDIRNVDDLDGIYLDLHGAMVVQSFEDGEGELLRRIRDIVGDDMPVVVSLDLHSNTTSAMWEHATAITMFRTYPHVDMAVTGARAVRHMKRALDGKTTYKAWRQSPFLVPLTAQHTGSTPCRELYAKALNMGGDGILSAELSMGFPPADIHDAGPVVVAYGETQGAADAAADDLFQALLDAEPAFDDQLISPEEAVRRAMARDQGPVVIADAQDNAGAGASSDTVGVLEALINGRAQGAVLALLDDAESAVMAHDAGEGAEISLSLGGKSGQPGQQPFHGKFLVEALGDGRIKFSGTMYGGFEGDLGAMASLRVVDDTCDVRVVVGSIRCQCLDQDFFRHVGIEPSEQHIVVVKSSVHFRADFEPIAKEVLVAEAPGAHPCRLENVEYKNLRHGVRLGALGPVFGA